MLTLAVIFLLTISNSNIPCLKIGAIWTGGTITIKPDGTIEPSDAPLKRDGDIYVLTDDIEITYGIIVEKDNITIDGNNHLLNWKGSGQVYWNMIQLVNRKGVRIRNLRIKNFGIYLHNSSNNEIIGNKIESGCIYLSFSKNNKIANNSFINGLLSVWSSYNNSVKDNTVNGKPIVYFENEHGRTIKDIDVGQLILVKCSDMVIENLDLFNTSGIELFNTNNSIIRNNRLEKGLIGIGIINSLNNEITENTIDNNNDGIVISGGVALGLLITALKTMG